MLPVILGIEIPPPSSSLASWSQIISGIGTVVLTLFLVILYRRQQRQLAAEHEAIIHVEGYEFHGDRAIVWLSNYGNGVSKNLGLTTLVKADNGEHKQYELRSDSLQRIGGSGATPGLIRPGEEKIPFYASSGVRKPSNPKMKRWNNVSFSDFVDNAFQNGAKRVSYLHLIEGGELSGRSSRAYLYSRPRVIGGHFWDHCDSVEDVGSWEQGDLHTFWPYLKSRTFWPYVVWIYVRLVRVADRVIPRIKFQRRVYDASGTGRVQRFPLNWQIRRELDNFKKWVTPW